MRLHKLCCPRIGLYALGLPATEANNMQAVFAHSRFRLQLEVLVLHADVDVPRCFSKASSVDMQQVPGTAAYNAQSLAAQNRSTAIYPTI
jgi:hypothetical protein